jgi:hypothetical protein
MKRIRIVTDATCKSQGMSGREKNLDPLTDMIQSLAHEICDIAAVVTERVIGDTEEDDDKRERLFLAGTYLLLNLSERDLALSVSGEKVDDVVYELIEMLTKGICKKSLSQDIIPGKNLEYFATFFESNYRLCAGQLALYPLPTAALRQPGIVEGFSDWTNTSFADEVDGKLFGRLLWETWVDRKLPDKLHALKTSLRDSF